MFDLAIIGGGPAGYNGAIKAAELGMTVALIEKAHLGGTCLNHGCIPTKCLLKSAELIEEIHSSGIFGVSADNISFSQERIYERKDGIIEKLRKAIAFLMKKNNISVFEGEASFIDSNNISVNNNGVLTEVSAKNIIIATGSSPAKL
ncbi:MAG: FAD-dependent oxidoreductase, partial [Clostridia bacterium]|nr:FAD-dependent oxidoreductase [Clostridia bacterium]